jgi:hypothetical protein
VKTKYVVLIILSPVIMALTVLILNIHSQAAATTITGDWRVMYLPLIMKQGATVTSTTTATVTPTPTATAGATSTATATSTPTATGTSTPTATVVLRTSTPTPTVTLTPFCGGLPTPAENLSIVSVSVERVWANGWAGSSRVIVTLKDACGQMVTGWDPTHTGSKFQIVSSRGTLDHIIWEGDVNNVGQYAWRVDSLTVGTSSYSVQVDVSPTATADWRTLTPAPSVTFICIVGVDGVDDNALSLEFAYSNPVDLNTIRRAISLTLEFTPRVGATGPFGVTSIAWGSAENVIWAGPQTISTTSPLVIGSAGWNSPGLGGRSIGLGVTNKPLRFFLGHELANSGTYTLTTTWDDGTGTNLCTSAPVHYP